jgi:hypothetical protein
MCNSVWQPSKNIQNDIFMRREYVAKIGTVEYILESREHADPDRRPIVAGNKPVRRSVRVLASTSWALDFFGGLCNKPSWVRVIFQNERQPWIVAEFRKRTTYLQE